MKILNDFEIISGVDKNWKKISIIRDSSITIGTLAM
jgi:hypothetical protein